jgi:DNA polymerase I
MPSPSQKLFLLDAMALIYRAHFAFSKNPRITSKGLNTGAVFGFTNTLLEIIQKEKPSHLGIAFDTSAPTFRHTQFEAYKAQRQAQPEDITIAIPLVKKLAAGFHIPILELDGYEADDIIGTIAWQAADQGFEVFMMTPDKDYGQLVREHVYLYKPSFMGKEIEVMGIKEVLQKWEIDRIDQVTDMLGLMGDKVDNIPGIPGVGEKTATKLLKEYGSVENLITHAGDIPGKMGENIRNFGEQGILSKQLAVICTTVPVPFEPENLLYTGPDASLLKPLFEELEFRTLASRILGSSPVAAGAQKVDTQTGQISLFDSPAANVFVASPTEEGAEEEVALPKKRIDNTAHNYIILKDEEEIRSLTEFLLAQKSFCFDTETDELDPLKAQLVGLSFCYRAYEAYYIPVPPDHSKALELLSWLKPALCHPDIGKIGQNIKYDFQVLKNYGLQLKGPLQDTMLMHYLLEPDMRHNMDSMSEHYLNYSPVSITTLIGKKGASQGNMREVAVEEIADYAAEDADITFQLSKLFAPAVEKQGLYKLYSEVEAPLIQVLADMEREGIRIDVEALKEISQSLEKEIKVSEAKVFELAGMAFNLSSPKQLGEVLFEHLKLDPQAKKTKTGQYATGEEVLSRLWSEHPIVSHILDYREFQKLKSTYVDALPLLIHSSDGRVHTSYNQAVAATGRLSSTNPNLQNIPIRTDKGREIRKAFVPRNDDYLLLSADYSQIELRIIADFSGDTSMIQAFKEGKDIHSLTASKVYGVSLDQVNSDMRRKAKMVNFGIIYGISAFGLAQRLDIPRKEAASIIDAYFREFPAIKTYMDSIINKAREQKYVETLLGRRRYLRDIDSRNQTMRGFAERNAINAPIQGSAADMIKIAMIRLHDRIHKEGLKSKMLLQVHDELVFDVHRSEIDQLKSLAIEEMGSAMDLKVPLEVSVGVGLNWLEAH